MMSDLIWKLKVWFRKIIPLVMICGLSYGAYTLYKQGVFGRKFTHTLNSYLSKIPVFGSKFSKGNASASVSYAKPTSIRKASHIRKHKKKHARRGKIHSRRRHQHGKQHKHR